MHDWTWTMSLTAKYFIYFLFIVAIRTWCTHQISSNIMHNCHQETKPATEMHYRRVLSQIYAAFLKANSFLDNYWNSPCGKSSSHYGSTMEAIEQWCTSKEQYPLAANYQPLDFNGLFVEVGSKINQNCCPKMVLFQGPNLFTGLHQCPECAE